MIYQLDMDDETRTYLAHLPPVRKRKVKEAMRSIAHDPARGKALQQELTGLCSYRVGILRIVYMLNRPKRMVHVIALGPRQTIYEEVEKALRVLKE